MHMLFFGDKNTQFFTISKWPVLGLPAPFQRLALRLFGLFYIIPDTVCRGMLALSYKPNVDELPSLCSS